MDKLINKDAFCQYQQIFGTEKMKALWQEFAETSRDKLDQIENKSPEEIRLAFHSMRSSSLVFGLESFSKSCAEIEEKILNGENLTKLKKYIDKSKIIFDNSNQSVAEFFE